MDVFFQVAVRGHDIEASVQIVIEEKKAELEQGLAGRAHAFLEGLVGKNERVPLLHIEGIHLVGEVADGDSERVVIAKSRGVNSHRAASGAKLVKGDR